MIENGEDIVLYCTRWCPGCWRAKKVLESMQIAYREIDISQDEAAAARVMELNRGFRSVPTIVFPDGSTLTEPRTDELKNKLNAYL